MTAVPLRWNPLMRDLGKSIAVSLVSANLVLGITGLRFLRSGGDALPWITATVWLGPAVYLLLLAWRGRSLRWELALPVRAGDLWRRHLQATAASGLLIWLVTVAAVWLMFGLIRLIGGNWAYDPPGILAACLCGAAGLLPLAAWAHRRRPELRTLRVPVWVDVLAGILTLGMAMAALRYPLPALSAAAALTVALLVRGAAAVPAAWSAPIASTDAAESSEPADMSPKRWRWSADLRFGAMIYRAAPRGILMALFMFPTTAVFGLLMGGGAARLLPESELRLLFLPMAAYVLLAGSAFPLAGLRAVDSLPLGRNRLLGLMLVPYVAALLLGYAGGAVWNRSTVVEGERILFVNEEERYGLMVPMKLFEVAGEGSAPVVEAPWGESHAMLTLPVFGEGETGDGPVLWKPYTVPRGASQEFAGWQLSRALEALHGEIFDPVELAERYFVVNSDGDVEARGGELTFAADHPDLRDRGTAPLLPLILGLLGILWLLPYAVFLTVCRVGYTVGKRKKVLWSQMGVLLILHILAFMSPVLGWFQPDRFEVAAASGLRQLAATLSLGSALLWVPALLILAAAWWLTARNFRVLEADHAACSVCLLSAQDEGRS